MGQFRFSYLECCDDNDFSQLLISIQHILINKSYFSFTKKNDLGTTMGLPLTIGREKSEHHIKSMYSDDSNRLPDDRILMKFLQKLSYLHFSSSSLISLKIDSLGITTAHDGCAIFPTRKDRDYVSRYTQLSSHAKNVTFEHDRDALGLDSSMTLQKYFGIVREAI